MEHGTCVLGPPKCSGHWLEPVPIQGALEQHSFLRHRVPEKLTALSLGLGLGLGPGPRAQVTPSCHFLFRRLQ